MNRIVARRDRGPFLYREPRLSMGEEFDLLKFRTLRRAALTRQAGEEAHARLLESDSDNLTWAGRRILKPWYLDELPQLLNVVKGDMSLVGPRPWPPSMAEAQLDKGLTYRNEVPAGWTGLAQVHKDRQEPARYTELDLEYVDACRTLSPLAPRALRPRDPLADGEAHGARRGAAVLTPPGTTTGARRCKGCVTKRSRRPMHPLDWSMLAAEVRAAATQLVSGRRRRPHG